MNVPHMIQNYIGGRMIPAVDAATFVKRCPHSGKQLTSVARSKKQDVDDAINAAATVQSSWAETNVVKRGDFLRAIALRMRERRVDIADIVSAETGKARAHALGETDAAIEMGLFMAGEGRRYYGRTTTASMDHRAVMTVRQPLGLAALIIASNTPIANVAWKAFPAILCGNVSIMKPSEDTPATAWIFAEICHEMGLPAGVFNVVQGLGLEAGDALVVDPRVDLVSFTGGHKTGAHIQAVAGARLAKVCMELGGKNALVVCDDADLDHAVKWVLASAFSNAGQRCAAASRIVVFDQVYERFRDRLVKAARSLTLGPRDEDFLGPVINERALKKMINFVRQAAEDGARILVGGDRVMDEEHVSGYYMAPTIIENVGMDADISQSELFGPVTILYRARDFNDALRMVNNSSFGLTASIHTSNLDRAMLFSERAEVGVVVVNGGTHGSEPHMGFGGLKNSGTGWREAGIESLDVYSDWKYINIISDPGKV